MKIAAIPTKYNGVQFRSRLEARWAAFFDLMNWKWQYEPVDFKGWIPDFVIGDDLETGCYVEVKPIDYCALEKSNLIMKPLLDEELQHARKCVPESSRGFVVAGLQPFFQLPKEASIPMISPVWMPQHRKYSFGCISEGWGRFDIPVGSKGVHPGLMTGLNFDCLQDDIDLDSFIDGSIILNLWKSAGNATQWRSPVNR